MMNKKQLLKYLKTKDISHIEMHHDPTGFGGGLDIIKTYDLTKIDNALEDLEKLSKPWRFVMDGPSWWLVYVLPDENTTRYYLTEELAEVIKDYYGI